MTTSRKTTKEERITIVKEWKELRRNSHKVQRQLSASLHLNKTFL